MRTEAREGQGHTGRGHGSLWSLEWNLHFNRKPSWEGQCHHLIFRLVNVIYLQFRKVTLAAQVENERKVRLKTGEHPADTI